MKPTSLRGLGRTSAGQRRHGNEAGGEHLAAHRGPGRGSVPGVAAGGVPDEVPWDTYIAALSPWAWLELDDAASADAAADASGNNRPGLYPNGSWSDGTHPIRRSTALVNGSTWGIVTNPAGDELTGNGYGNAMSGSWTFGMVVKSTSTASMQYLMGTGSWNFSVNLNHDALVWGADPGCLSLSYDATGANANALSAFDTGWNDGDAHLIMFEHDSVADTLSIWQDGVEIATRARAGTKPNLAGANLHILRSNVASGMGVDEVLWFDKVLTPTEHAAIATYVL